MKKILISGFSPEENTKHALKVLRELSDFEVTILCAEKDKSAWEKYWEEEGLSFNRYEIVSNKQAFLEMIVVFSNFGLGDEEKPVILLGDNVNDIPHPVWEIKGKDIIRAKVSDTNGRLCLKAYSCHSFPGKLDIRVEIDIPTKYMGSKWKFAEMFEPLFLEEVLTKYFSGIPIEKDKLKDFTEGEVYNFFKEMFSVVIPGNENQSIH